MNESLIPAISFDDAWEKHGEAAMPFLLFAREITRNAFLKDYLWKRQNGLCPWCNQPLETDSPVIGLRPAFITLTMTMNAGSPVPARS